MRKLSLGCLFAVLVAACVVKPLPPTPTDRAFAVRTCVGSAQVRLGAPQIPVQAGYNPLTADGKGDATFGPVTNSLPSGFILEADAPGYPHYSVQVNNIRPGDQQYLIGNCVPLDNPSFQVQLAVWSPLFPRPPTRAQVIGMQLTFQGLTVQTQKFGAVKWFEPWLDSLTPEDRQAVYKAKKAAGDTHLNLFFPTHNGGYYGQFSQFPSTMGEENPQQFLGLVEEVIRAGFIPVIAYDGDNGDAVENGHYNALRQLPILYTLLKSSRYGDLNKYVLKARFYDGVFYGSSPENIMAFGAAFRALDPDGYLIIQHNPGHIPIGEGVGDYNIGGRMWAYDAVAGEFDDSEKPYQGNDTIWQIVGRMVQPYHRPADQVGDPTPPFYLTDSERGPRTYICMEYSVTYGAYAWVRDRVSATDVQRHRQYFLDIGCKYVG